jgi:hypothetical protein
MRIIAMIRNFRMPRNVLFAVGGLVLLALAFEAHILSVTAQIEGNSLVPIADIGFGTVFPQEKLDKTFGVELSASFLAAGNLDALDYRIRQKPKCWNGSVTSTVFGRVEDVNGVFVCEDDGFTILPGLCPYLSGSEITSDGNVTSSENDSAGIAAFHGLPGLWTPSTTDETEVRGALIKSASDTADEWNVDLKVPCFDGQCAQDWATFVAGVNPDADANDYIQPQHNRGELFGCDLWLEVTDERPPVGCQAQLDLMLVLDRSGSLDAGELATLKTAAKAFVDDLAPSASSSHIGMSSFATTSTLNLHLSSNSSTIKTAIDGLIAGGFTNLLGGLNLAISELANPGDGHDRTDITSPDTMVVITDGLPNRPLPFASSTQLAAIAADNARAAGIEVYVVGVGVTTSTELYLKTDIADDAAHYFAAANFGDLGAILEDLASCN